MRDVGQHLPAQEIDGAQGLVAIGELLAHAVEGARDQRDFVSAVLGPRALRSPSRIRSAAASRAANLRRAGVKMIHDASAVPAVRISSPLSDRKRATSLMRLRAGKRTSPFNCPSTWIGAVSSGRSTVGTRSSSGVGGSICRA